MSEVIRMVLAVAEKLVSSERLVSKSGTILCLIARVDEQLCFPS